MTELRSRREGKYLNAPDGASWSHRYTFTQGRSRCWEGEAGGLDSVLHTKIPVAAPQAGVLVQTLVFGTRKGRFFPLLNKEDCAILMAG